MIQIFASPHSRAIVAMLCFLLLSLPLSAGDLAREKRIASELSDAIVEGDSLFLEVGGHRFWNIYTEAAVKSDDAAILIHGRGLHPDWPAVVNPLRTELPDHGFSTLSMQMPVLPKGSVFKHYSVILDEAGPRIEAGISHLQQLGYKRIHLIAHSCGAQMTMRWLDNGGGKQLDSLILVSLGMKKYSGHFGHKPPLAQQRIPLLDVYGEQDFLAKSAAERLGLITQAGHPLSHQVAISGGKHMMKKQSDLVVDAVASWLKKLHD